MLSDEELLRYSRQILMPAFDVAGQRRLKAAHVLVVGAGGLGCPVALYLGAAGIGRLTLVDDDVVELANLQRQVAFIQDDLGQSKAEVLAARVRRINPGIEVRAHPVRLDGPALTEAVAAADLVVDCSDNFATRFALNRACVGARVPLVSGAAIRGEGQLSVFDVRLAHSPCYHCLYPEQGNEDLTCSEAGVIAPVVGLVGSAQAMEAIKVISGVGEPLVGRLLLLDAWRMQWREMALTPDPGCPVCARR
ncbi:molybdopterin-synthase adenylyltransferase MoeB [Marinobacter lutaoensis]|jgi:adenylyltransferase/sulfurtransferase|uniref:Molybdopterin-synthase adenylyltransferase n=1 Tax=Marinobacter lutaoensis TaxID=135739 RepID=A0A1V2DQG9_9GAMM|nr:molybdopterin-synthase adenylyltransferase MoeB [Marinobacter lutaoensis]MBE02369.1 molybdopterin-synthase adenylyltransferase MoeB [Marinobacter sp.]MBI42571.1 molybdopterin-synthase adenylyltransferase MoeB [Oceanospirillales bacterium]NVD34689.1 molybdopterin-synthase adenylyltransferase MoeB [Marinobacter lutaoensis]ONF42779.1 molybdopterin-synthase adenylyltransferase MoeB [Marinobacter lutaoensis]|tara:strand:- start:60 stop:809 length:750 start_codon:yes stop_codon:yes gene_type:complete